MPDATVDCAISLLTTLLFTNTFFTIYDAVLFIALIFVHLPVYAMVFPHCLNPPNTDLLNQSDICSPRALVACPVQHCDYGVVVGHARLIGLRCRNSILWPK